VKLYTAASATQIKSIVGVPSEPKKAAKPVTVAEQGKTPVNTNVNTSVNTVNTSVNTDRHKPGYMAEYMRNRRKGST